MKPLRIIGVGLLVMLTILWMQVEGISAKRPAAPAPVRGIVLPFDELLNKNRAIGLGAETIASERLKSCHQLSAR